MRTQISLEMGASPQAVFELAADVSSWSRKLPHYRRSQVTGRFAGRVLVAFTALRPIVRSLRYPGRVASHLLDR